MRLFQQSSMPHKKSSLATSTTANNHHRTTSNARHNNVETYTIATTTNRSYDNHDNQSTASQRTAQSTSGKSHSSKDGSSKRLKRKHKLSRAISTPFRKLREATHNHHHHNDSLRSQASHNGTASVSIDEASNNAAVTRSHESDYPCQLVQDRRRSSYGKSKSAKSLIQLGVDLEREKTRLESFEAYVLVSILTASASFSVLDAGPLHQSSFPPIGPPNHSDMLDENGDTDWVQTLTVFAAGMSAICGLHATIVFSLCVLYGKTALGLKKDVAYDGFLRQVAAQRIRGFNTFSASLLLFAVECALLLYTHVPAQYSAMALLFTTLIVRDWYAIVHAATTQIFQSQHDHTSGARQSFMEFADLEGSEKETENANTNDNRNPECEEEDETEGGPANASREEIAMNGADEEEEDDDEKELETSSEHQPQPIPNGTKLHND